jgi:hypothetical protein
VAVITKLVLAEEVEFDGAAARRLPPIGINHADARHAFFENGQNSLLTM